MGKLNKSFMTLVLVFATMGMLALGCNPNPGVGGDTKTAGGGGGTNQRPPPQSIINTFAIDAQNDQITISGRYLSHVSKVRMTGPNSFDHTFSISAKDDTGITAKATAAISFLLNGAYNLILSNAYGQVSFSVSITLDDNSVTGTKLAQSGATNGQVLKWDSVQGKWIPSDDVGAGAGGGTVTQVNLGKGIVGDGGNFTTTGSIVIDTGTTGDGTATKIVHFSTTQVQSRYNLEVGTSSQILLSEGTTDFIIFNDNSLRIADSLGTNLFTIDGTGAVTITGSSPSLQVGGLNVCLSDGTNCTTANVGSTEITDGSVATVDLADNSVTSLKIVNGAVSLVDMAGDAVNSGTIVDNSIMNADINSAADIDATKLGTGVIDNTEFSYLNNVTSNIQTQLNAKEPLITAGTTAQYLRGDKSFQTLNTDAVTEATNLYYTDARAIAAPLTGYAVGANAALAATDTILQAFGKLEGQTSAMLPLAGGTMTGAINMGSQNITSAGSITATDLTTSAQGAITVGAGAANTGEIRFNELTPGTNYVGFKAPDSIASDLVWTLPAADGASGSVLSTNAAGVLSWITGVPPTGAAGGSLTGTYPNPALATNSVDTAQIFDNAVTTPKIVNDAVTLDKLYHPTTGSLIIGSASGPVELDGKTSGQVLVGNGTTMTSVAISNDATLAADGNLTIANDAVETAMIANDQVTLDKLQNITQGSLIVGGASGAPTLLDSKTSGQILVGDGTDLKSVALSGDATLSSAGALTISNNAVTSAKIADGEIVNADISATAAIDRSKIAAGTADHVLINDGSGNLSSEAQLAISRGGTNKTSYTTAGNILFYDGTSLTEDDGQLFWDSGNNRLSLAGTTPEQTLDVRGSAIIGDNTNAGALILRSTDATDEVTITVPSAASLTPYTLVLPTTAGSNGQALTTNGSGVLSWAGVASSTLNSGQIYVGNVSNVATAVNMSGEATITNAGAVTLDNDSVITKTLTSYTAGSGDPVAADNIRGAIQKVDGNVDALNTSLGTAQGAADLGTFTGATISDNTTVKNALQELETKAEASDALSELTDTTIAAPSSAQVLIYDGTDSWDNKSISGDITIDNTGAASIGTGKVTSDDIGNGEIVDEDVSATAAIAGSKIKTTATGNITSINADSAIAELELEKLALAGGTMTGTLNMGSQPITGAGSVSATDLTTSATAGIVVGSTTTTTGQIRFNEATNNGVNYVALRAPADAGASDVIYTLPSSNPTSDGQVLSSTTAGLMSWIDALTTSLTNGKIFIGDGTGVATQQTISGDITMTNTGVTSIGTNKVTSTMVLDGTIATADVADNAITLAKMADVTQGSILIGGATDPVELDVKTSGNILVGSGTTAASVAMSGDATLASNGALTISSGAVAATELAPFVGGGVIVGQDLLAPAIVDLSVTNASILIGNVSGTAGAYPLSGDVTMDNVGVTSIGTGKVTSTMIADSTITNSDISATAAITYSKLSIADGDLSIAKTSGLQTALDAKIADTGDTMTGALNMAAENEVRFQDNTGGEYVGLKAPATVTTSLTFTLPSVDGSAGFVLKTDGSKGLAFADPSTLVDNKIKVSSNDTTADYLFNKLAAGSTKLSISETNDAGDEDVTLDVVEANIVHDNLSGFVANEHVDHSTVSVATASGTSGLTGGGTIAATRNLSVDITGTTDEAAPATTDELLFYDGSASALKKSDIAAIVNLADHDSLTNFLADEHIAHSSVSIATATGTSGLSGGGTIASTRNLVVDIAGTTAETSADDADSILIHDNSAGALREMTRANFLSGVDTKTVSVSANDTTPGYLLTKLAAASGITLTETTDGGDEDVTIDVDEANIDHDSLQNFVANEHVDHSSISISAGDGIKSTGLGDLTATRTINIDVALPADVTASTANKILDASSVIDEDTMATDSNSKVPTQQSVKAYADTQDALKLSLTGGTMSGALNLATQNEVRFQDAADGEYVGIKAPTTVGTSYTYTLPDTAGTNGYVLQTNGSGVLSWVDPATTGDITDVTTASGSGLSGGVTSGNANLQVVVDNSTVEIATNTIQVKDSGITSAKIADGTVATDDLANNSVDLTKLLDVTQGSILIGGASDPVQLDVKTSGNILVGNGTTATSVAVSGDATLASGGALTIANDAVTLAKMAGLAQGNLIVGDSGGNPSALAAGTDGQILIGNTGNLTSVGVTGDVTISNTGVTSIGTGKVTSDDILDGSIVNADVSASAAIAGSKIATTAIGNIAATDADSAIAELETEKLALAGGTMTGTLAMGANNITGTGTVSAGSYSSANQSGLALSPFGAGAGNTGEVRFLELTAGGSDYVGLKAPDSIGTSLVYTLPNSAPTTGQVLSSTSGGVMSWVTTLTNSLASGNILVGNGSGEAASVAMSGDVTLSNTGVATIASNAVGSTEISDASIATADIANDAVTLDKLQNITQGSIILGGASGAPTETDIKGDGKILVGNGTTATSVSVSGDATLTNAGLLTIPDNAVAATELADFVDGGVIVGTGLATDPTIVNLSAADASILVGAFGGGATARVISGDAIMSNTGVLTIGTGAITTGKILDGTIANADISATAAITYSKLSIADGDLSIAKTSGLQTALDAKVADTGDTMTGALNMAAENEVRFQDNTGGEYVGLKAPATVTTSLTFTLPSVDGSAGFVLKTDGSKGLAFADPSTLVDNKIKVSSNDTTADYLFNKLAAGSTKLSISETNDAGDEDVTLDVVEANIVHDNLSGFVANEHVDHSTVSVATASGTSGLTGGGTIATTRNLSVDITGTTDEAAPTTTDELLLYDGSASALKKSDIAAIVNLADHDSLTNFVADEHIAHSGVSITTATNSGLTGGGDITASRSLSVDINGTADEAAPLGTDEILIYDASNTGNRKTDIQTVVNLADHDSLTNFVANEHIDHTSVSIATAAGTSGLSGGGTIASTRNLVVDIAGTTAETSADDADSILIHDNSAGALREMTRANFLSGVDTKTVSVSANDTTPGYLLTKLAAASGITLTETTDGGDEDVTIDVDEANIDHDSLQNFVANEHVDHSSISISAGDGIKSTGLGDLTATRTINIDVALPADVTASTANKILDASSVIDEDTMATDSNSKVPTQQSVKAYADTQDALKLSLTGGTMSGALNMGSQAITSAGSISATDLTTSATAGIVVGSTATTTGQVRFNEATNNGANYIGIQAATDVGASDVIYTLPSSVPGSNGQVLSSTTAGVMSWTSVLNATLSDGTLYIGNNSNVATERTISGDISLSNTGVASIGTGVVVDADINAAANITATKLGTGVVDNTEFNRLNGLDQNLATTDSPSFAAATINGNITVTGNVDGRDVSTDGSTLDNLNTTIGLSALDSTEVDQLEAIGATTISATQWGYLGASNQGIATTDSPTFAAATINGNITVTGNVDGRDVSTDGSTLDNLNTTIGLSALTTAEVNQLENIGDSTTISATQWGYLGASNQGIATTDSPTFAAGTISGNLTVDTNTLYVDAANNRVGIGTTSPDGELHVNGSSLIVGTNDTSAGFLRAYGHGTTSAEGGEIQLYLAADHDGSQEWWRIDAYEDDLRFGPTGTTRVTFKNDGDVVIAGNVGIGVAPTAGYKLDVGGSGTSSTMRVNKFEITDSNSAVVLHNKNAGSTLFYNEVGVSDTSLAYRFHATTSHAAKMDILNNGTMYVYGPTTCIIGTGSGATNCTSDERLKENIVPIENAIDKIMKINGVEYDWNEKAPSPGTHAVGVIAQNVLEIFPTLVHKDERTGYYSVGIAGLVAPLIEATKEQQAMIERNKEMLAVMQGKWEEHERRIASLEEEVEKLKEENRELRAIKEEHDQMKAFLCQSSPEAAFCK